MSDPLLDRHTAAQQAFTETYRRELEQLARDGQKPVALFIGCADSRIVPERLFGLAPGMWFMLHNVGNIVPPYAQTELSTAAALEFAVITLQVAHIVVCGHSDCGAMKALLNPVPLSQQPGLARWVEIARPALRPAQEKSLVGGTPLLRCLTEENVCLQLTHLRTYPYVRTAEDSGTLQLHGWIYDIGRHEVHALVPG